MKQPWIDMSDRMPPAAPADELYLVWAHGPLGSVENGVPVACVLNRTTMRFASGRLVPTHWKPLADGLAAQLGDVGPHGCVIPSRWWSLLGAPVEG